MAALGVDFGPAVGGKPMTSIGAERKPMLKSAASGLARSRHSSCADVAAESGGNGTFPIFPILTSNLKAAVRV
jgi:hypothetical protein